MFTEATRNHLWLGYQPFAPLYREQYFFPKQRAVCLCPLVSEVEPVASLRIERLWLRIGFYDIGVYGQNIWIIYIYIIFYVR